VCDWLQPVIRRVVHDGQGHVIASTGDHRPSHGDPAIDWSAVALDDVEGDGVSTTRYQELYSRASRHLVRLTASRVDASGNHSSPYGESD